ncbi:endonuclease III, partial [Christensenellaceae bacterium OttesenSCG-928-M15]|nr:endonuclease III [Christensenellaceae bacterium OttesenSCG-928-M15]
MLSKKKMQVVLKKLSEEYPSPKPELEFESPFELLIATMLSAQTTDKQVNKCTRVLFPVYNTPEAFVALTEEELYPYIKTCGLYLTKGKNIIATCKLLLTEYGGEVPKTREELMKLPGVGRKTANVVISNAFHVPAIAVDTHVFRVSNRIGFANAKDVLKTEEQLMQNIPEKDWGDAHHWIIFHGRRVCYARNPNCPGCCISAECEYYT